MIHNYYDSQSKNNYLYGRMFTDNMTVEFLVLNRTICRKRANCKNYFKIFDISRTTNCLFFLKIYFTQFCLLISTYFGAVRPQRLLVHTKSKPKSTKKWVFEPFFVGFNNFQTQDKKLQQLNLCSRIR